jgi:hypothetical protein
LPASGTFETGSFPTNDLSNPLNIGILDSVVSVEGLSVLLFGQIIPNSSVLLGSSVGSDGAGTGTYTFTGPFNLQLKIPINVPFEMNFGGTIINGTETGQLVANMFVPEPAGLLSAGLGMIAFAMLIRRRRRSFVRERCGPVRTEAALR